MPADTASSRRLRILAGATLWDVSVDGNDSVRELLVSLKFPIDSDDVVVVDEIGREVALDSAVSTAFEDGGSLCIVERGPHKGALTSDTPVADEDGIAPPYSHTAQVIPALTFIAPTVIIGALSLLNTAGSITMPSAARWATAAVALVVALLMALVVNRADRSVVLAVAPLLAVAGGMVALDPAAHSITIMVMVGTIAGATIATIRYASIRTAHVLSSAEGTVAMCWSVIAALFVISALAQLPEHLPAAIIVGVAPLVIAWTPSAALSVPPETLVDTGRFTTTAWQVREPRRIPFTRLVPQDVTRSIDHALERMHAATVMSSLAAPVFTIPVLVADTDSIYQRIGVIVMLVSVFTAMATAPRSSRDRLTRVVPRLGAAAMLLLTGVALQNIAQGFLPSIAAVALSVGLLCMAVALPISRGWKSVGWSRTGDIVEKLAMALSLPAALFAGGAFEWIQVAL